MGESMQQSSTTPSLHLGFLGLPKIVACSQPYLAVASCIYSFWHSVIPTSYFIFNDFYTCTINVLIVIDRLHNSVYVLSVVSSISSTSGSLTAETTSVCYSITVTNNDVVELNGTIVVKILSSSLHPPATILRIAEANIIVVNDDSELWLCHTCL